MIDNILEYVRVMDYGDIIVTSEYIEALSQKVSTTIISDARSAIFYALGRSNLTCKTSYVVISGRELPSALTGATEAFYQNKKVVIIVTDNVHNNYTNWKAVTGDIFEISSYEDAKTVLDIYHNQIITKPILLILKEQVYYKIYSIDMDFKLDCFKRIFITDNLKFRDNDIIESQDYIKIWDKPEGIVSFFFGHCCANSSTQLLVTDSAHILRDVNSFMLRPIRKINNARILVLAEKEFFNNFESWVVQNDFNYYRFDTVKNGIEALNKANKSTVVEVQLQ